VPTRFVAIETDPGELIDKIAILQINAEGICDCEQLRNVRTDHEKKPLHGQAIDWHPDPNDGVHMKYPPPYLSGPTTSARHPTSSAPKTTATSRSGRTTNTHGSGAAKCSWRIA
jgi:hypothetical protein